MAAHPLHFSTANPAIVNPKHIHITVACTAYELLVGVTPAEAADNIWGVSDLGDAQRLCRVCRQQ